MLHPYLKTILIVFILLFGGSLNTQISREPQIINLCDTLYIDKKYWVDGLPGYQSRWIVEPGVNAQGLQDNTLFVRWDEPGQYTIIAQYTNGNCISQTEVIVKVEGCPELSIYVPNAFTPNDDNLNETFGAYGFGLDKFNITIFNRWGELIFESDDINKQWNGTYKGQICQEDVYVYHIVYKGFNRGYKDIYGKILLIK
jgi:gliding motility-associated-like protein